MLNMRHYVITIYSNYRQIYYSRKNPCENIHIGYMYNLHYLEHDFRSGKGWVEKPEKGQCKVMIWFQVVVGGT